MHSIALTVPTICPLVLLVKVDVQEIKVGRWQRTAQQKEGDEHFGCVWAEILDHKLHWKTRVKANSDCGTEMLICGCQKGAVPVYGARGFVFVLHRRRRLA